MYFDKRIIRVCNLICKAALLVLVLCTLMLFSDVYLSGACVQPRICSAAVKNAPSHKTKRKVKRYKLPKNRGFKSYLRYWKIVNESNQKTLMENSYENKLGFRKYDSRYCIAIGTHFNAPVGTYVDLVLKNKKVIHCIVGDIKADKDTDKNNIFTRNGCCSEFIVNEEKLTEDAAARGDVSYCYKGWKSPVKYIRVYDYNVFEEGELKNSKQL